MAKEKRKNYQEIKNSNDKMMSKETQNALLGILLFLLCLIGLLENGGPLGRIIRYIFVFLLGTFFPFALLVGCLLGIILFIKREVKPVKLGLTAWSGIIFVISLLVLSSENNFSLAVVFKNYRDLFTSVDRGGLMVIVDSSLGGGIIGFFFYSLVAALVGDIGVKIVFFVLLLLFGYLFFKPVLFYFINMFTKHLNKRQEYERITRNDDALMPKKSLFNDELEIEEPILTEDSTKIKEDLFSDEDELEPIFGEKISKDNKIVVEDLTDDDILINKQVYKEKYAKESAFTVNNNNFNEELFVPKKEIKKDTFDIFSDSIFKSEDVQKVRENKLINKIEKEASGIKSFDIFENNEKDVPIEEIKNEKIVEQPLAREIDIDDDLKNYSSFNEERNSVNSQNIYNYSDNESIHINTEISLKEEVNNQNEIQEQLNDNSFTRYNDNKSEPKLNINNYQTNVGFSNLEKTKRETRENEIEKEKQTDAVNPFATYQLPSLGLLEDIKDNSYFENKQNALIKSKLINEKLAALGIKGRVVDQHVAPAFTRYEIALDSTEKMNQFANISKDLQSAVAAPSISILAPIPNSMNAGVDVPNAIRGMVGLKDVLANMSYDMPTLYVGLGKDSVGKVVGINLAETPHMLVAGSTGTGKSVCMNTLIISLIMHAKPDELKMIMIDPKRVEMASYHNIPHLACPVITDVRKAGVALQKVAKLMHERFKLFETLGVRNIGAYNRMMKKQNKTIMPYYVVFIDEMADLFNHVKSAEQTLIEICSLARAAGIHVVCATQRPSADIITSNIKVNIPSRIAFAVSSIGDSKTVLGQSGAENLLGKGDMIINVPGQLSYVRAQGAYVSDEDIEVITEFIKKQAEPVYNPTLLDLEPETNSEIDFDGSDSKDSDLANMVIEFIKKVAQVSTTKVQNRFNIGYPKAARIMDLLNDKGIIMKDPITKLWVLSDTYMDEEIRDE